MLWEKATFLVKNQNFGERWKFLDKLPIFPDGEWVSEMEKTILANAIPLLYIKSGAREKETPLSLTRSGEKTNFMNNERWTNQILYI